MISITRYVLIAFSTVLFFSPLWVNAQESVESDVSPTPGRFQQFREKLKEQRDEMKDRIKTEIEAKKEEIQSQREKMKTEWEAKKAEFQKIKDERKRMTVTNLAERINEINTNRTDHLLTVVDKMETILDKVASKGADLKKDGVDTATLETAIADADTAIQKARTAIQQQQLKKYEFTITDENNLRDVVAPVVKQFQEDFKTVLGVVKDAKEAVMNAARVLAQLHKPAEPTVSVTP